MSGTVLDTAGGDVGGAARWRCELDWFLRQAGTADITVVGRHRRLTEDWLLRREWQARGASVAVAANNVSFGFAGAQRRVVLRNALHFLHPSEEPLLAGMARSFRAQIPVVRTMLRRADLVVAPSTALAERVCRAVPSVRQRIVVRAHPVTRVWPRLPAEAPFLLVPVVPGPYKNLLPQLRQLLAALDRLGRRWQVQVTATPSQLPPDLRSHPHLTALGALPHQQLAWWWRRATAAFFPSCVEAFGYPLAEARVYGVPVLAPDTAQAREIAGPALLPYRANDPDGLAAALASLPRTVPAEPFAYDRDAYFRWLLALAAPPVMAGQEHHGSAT